VRERASDRRGVASMHDAVRDFLEDSGLARQMRQWPVFEAWSQAVGRDLARRAKPVHFARGELCVEVDSSAHMHELMNFTGERFRELANARLRERAGKSQIHRIVFRLKR
jgi:Dna[CI] antecedent, DciA